MLGNFSKIQWPQLQNGSASLPSQTSNIILTWHEMWAMQFPGDYFVSAKFEGWSIENWAY